jgi:hypothetical protein
MKEVEQESLFPGLPKLCLEQIVGQIQGEERVALLQTCRTLRRRLWEPIVGKSDVVLLPFLRGKKITELRYHHEELETDILLQLDDSTFLVVGLESYEESPHHCGRFVFRDFDPVSKTSSVLSSDAMNILRHTCILDAKVRKQTISGYFSGAGCGFILQNEEAECLEFTLASGKVVLLMGFWICPSDCLEPTGPLYTGLHIHHLASLSEFFRRRSKPLEMVPIFGSFRCGFIGKDGFAQEGGRYFDGACP